MKCKVKNGQFTNWQGCKADEKVDSRFPATLGDGMATIDLSDTDFGT
jgi:hypothetical protein